MCCVVLGLALAGAAWGQTQSQQTPSQQLEEVRENALAATTSYQPMEVMGMQVWIDPVTGQMRPPTPAEAAKLSAEMRKLFGARSQRGEQPQSVREQTLANGTVMLELGLGHLDFSVVHQRPDGSLEYGCVDDSHRALSFAQQGSQSPATAQPEVQ
ncbi:MAG: hypothetical protein DWQ36_08810 [Acidobacteria bacterium]|nr:MAG: hypothetical protein DWQ30_18250 [Acidobacteriota bacterium]REK08742.1 MAG: hypothetical protein DWQ36_08810 [Acidobacteriota bacterium]